MLCSVWVLKLAVSFFLKSREALRGIVNGLNWEAIDHGNGGRVIFSSVLGHTYMFSYHTLLFFFFFLVPIYTLRNTLPQSQLQTICCTQRAYTKPGYSHLTTMKHTKINSDQGRHTQVLRPWTLRSIQSLWRFFSKGKMLLVMLQLWMCSYPAKPCGE